MNIPEKYKIKENEKKPTGLVHSAEKLRQMILDNPDLPLVVRAGEDANSGDYSLMMCSSIKCEIVDFLDCNQNYYMEYVFTDRTEFEETIADSLYLDEPLEGLTDKEYDELVDMITAQYEPYWKKCILVTVDN